MGSLATLHSQYICWEREHSRYISGRLTAYMRFMALLANTHILVSHYSYTPTPIEYWPGLDLPVQTLHRGGNTKVAQRSPLDWSCCFIRFCIDMMGVCCGSRRPPSRRNDLYRFLSGERQEMRMHRRVGNNIPCVSASRLCLVRRFVHGE